MSERRARTRWTPAFVCAVDASAGDTLLRGELTDLSDLGARLHIPVPPVDAAALGEKSVGSLREGAELTLEFTIGEARERRVGLVVWTRPLEGAHALIAGVAFLGDPTPQSDWRPDEDSNLRRIALKVKDLHIDPRAALRIPTAVALRRRVLPLCEVAGHVVTACADVADRAAIETVERLFQLPVRPQPVDASDLAQTIVKVHGDPRLAAQAEDADPVAQFDQIMYAAWLRRASDIHVCPEKAEVRVLLRVDGQLEPFRSLPIEVHQEFLSRIKVLAGMDIAERRAPQDGRFTQDLPGGRMVDVRVATLPTNHGERATLRLLSIEAASLTLERLGMAKNDLLRCERSLRRPHGMILATGPTGCGKTTTLFAALRAITATRSVNAIAIQEPVEYDIPGISQVEIDSQKIRFAGALRSIMRHDPDVIMIGEIRDAETASIAIKAALTGHLVLATLHTNTAASAVTRLIDMGVERYLIAATLRLVIAQRLVRRLCPGCRRPTPLPVEIATLLGHEECAGQPVYNPGGCVFCAGRGFHGRLGLFELIEVDRELADAIRRGDQQEQIADAAREKGVPGFPDDALTKLLRGDTATKSVLEAVDIDPTLSGVGGA